MGTIATIARLTVREAGRKRLLLAGVLLGAAFVLVYATALYLILTHAECGTRGRPCATALERLEFRGGLQFGTLIGLYAANFLALITAVLLPLDTLSGEIASGVTQTLACKPIRRAEIFAGKWIAYWLLIAGYVALVAGGVIAAMWAVSAWVTGGPGFVVAGIARTLALILIEVTVMLTISIAGGAKFSTVTNGMIALGVFGVGFLGGWVEVFGELAVQSDAGRQVVRNIGTVISLVIPADALWRLAAYHLLPSFLRDLAQTPFTPMFPPSNAMVVWAIGYIVVVAMLGIRVFERRAL